MDISSLMPLLINILIRLAVAVALLFLGRWLAKAARRWLQPVLKKAELTQSMVVLFTTLAYYSILVGAVVSALAVIGFPVQTLVAVSGVALVLLGIALQQSIKDLAATVIFLLFKPFEVGDVIETKGITATVQEIQLFSTALVRWDNKVIVLPNAEIQLNGITNFSKMETLRTDLVFGISYDDDLLHAKQILAEIVAADPRVLPDPPPQILVLSLGDSSVNIGVRAGVTVQDYWALQNDLRERVKLRFDAEGITIPFPQRTIHVVPPADET